MMQMLRDFENFEKKHPHVAETGEYQTLKKRTGIYITEARDIVLEQRKLARVDDLTSLRNRKAFSEDLFREADRAIRHKHPLSLIFSDIDKLKRVNGTYGHGAGDTALKYISSALRESVRMADMVYRWGGDEFAVILPETDAGGAREIACRIRKATDHVYQYRSHKFGPVTVSQGIAMLQPNGEPYTSAAVELVENADKASRGAKKAGGNRIRVYRA